MGHLQVFSYTLFTIESHRYIHIFLLIYIVHKRLFVFVYTLRNRMQKIKKHITLLLMKLGIWEEYFNDQSGKAMNVFSVYCGIIMALDSDTFRLHFKLLVPSLRK
jgi:hypothetical protein